MKPLEGILVVAVEQALAAPFCTARLAEAGARVIKVERPEGDFARGYDDAALGSSSYFTWTNQGKESISLNFRETEGAEVLEKLIAKADVFIQNLAPGAMARAGFGSCKLRKKHPHLITVDISGYGESEEVSHLKAYDFLIQAEAGLTGISGGENEMGRIGVSICDIGAGMTSHAAVLEALILRKETNQGAAIAVSLFDVAADWMTVPFLHQEYAQNPPKRRGMRHPSIAPYGAFQTTEGTLTLISIQNEREWKLFCSDVLNSNTMGTDPRFISNNERVKHRDALEFLISEVTLSITQDEFRKRLSQAGVAFGGVNNVEEFCKHPALRRTQAITELGNKVEMPAPPIRWLDGAARSSLKPAPSIGEHNKKIRAEFA